MNDVPANRPRVFISSTIYDFQDLRSALRYWLQELGYDVQLSEKSDFDKSLSENSYQACLDAIKSADIFILLVGSRTGGWFDESKRLTITCAEYRTARELFERGELQMATFVRQSIWDIREDRKALESMLRKDYATLSEQDIRRIKHHRSRFVNDAEFIFDFLQEIAQLEKMKMAPPNDRPRGNWVHIFSDFGDIVNALRPHLVGNHSIRRMVVKANVRAELARIASGFLTSVEGTVVPLHRYPDKARRHIDLLGCDMDGFSEIPHEDLTGLWFWTLGPRAPEYRPGILAQALSSGEFYVYDINQKALRPTVVHRAIRELLWQLQRVESCQKVVTSEFPGENGYSPHLRLHVLVERAEKEGSSARLENRFLVLSCQLQDAHVNVLTLIEYINGSLAADDLDRELPRLRPASPRHPPERQPLVSEENAAEWLNKQGGQGG